MKMLTVTQLRSQLREAIDEAKSGRVVRVGAHRTPEVVLLAAESYDRLTARSETILPTLLAHSASATATQMLSDLRSQSSAWYHPGDSFGRVMAWLWDTGQADQLNLLVADLLAELRHHNKAAPEPGQRITLETLVRGIRLALPYGAPADDIAASLLSGVPGYSPSDDVTRP